MTVLNKGLLGGNTNGIPYDISAAVLSCQQHTQTYVPIPLPFQYLYAIYVYESIRFRPEIGNKLAKHITMLKRQAQFFFISPKDLQFYSLFYDTKTCQLWEIRNHSDDKDDQNFLVQIGKGVSLGLWLHLSTHQQSAGYL